MLREIIACTLTLAITSAVHAADDREPSSEAIQAYVKQYVGWGSFDGVVLVARGDRIAFHEAFGFADYSHRTPVTLSSRFRLASLSKQFTQAAIGRLVARGKLSFDTRLSRFFPDFPRGDEITVLQLLEHSSGIPHTNRLDWMSMKSPLALDEIVDGLSRESLDFEPGTDRRYSNGGYAMGAALIEAASGQGYAEFIRQEFAEGGYPTVGHEHAYQVVPSMAHRYAPGATPGTRVEATQYLVANRIGGGSIYGSAEDVFRFFRDTLRGSDIPGDIHEVLFAMPDDGDTRITGRSPGALAQIYYDINEDLTVVTLSSNSAWPGTFNRDITALFRGEPLEQIPVRLAEGRSAPEQERAAIVGAYQPERFRWSIRLERAEAGVVYVQNEMRTAFLKTVDGRYYLPIWDWLCRFKDDYASFTCRQRDPGSDAAFVFNRVD